MLAPSSWVYCNKKLCAKVNAQWNFFFKHFFEKRLFKTLVNATESNSPHFRVDKIWSVAHDDFQSAVFVCVLPSWYQVLHMQTLVRFFGIYTCLAGQRDLNRLEDWLICQHVDF